MDLLSATLLCDMFISQEEELMEIWCAGRGCYYVIVLYLLCYRIGEGRFGNAALWQDCVEILVKYDIDLPLNGLCYL